MLYNKQITDYPWFAIFFLSLKNNIYATSTYLLVCLFITRVKQLIFDSL